VAQPDAKATTARASKSTRIIRFITCLSDRTVF
jgi:hypothetical protein